MKKLKVLVTALLLSVGVGPLFALAQEAETAPEVVVVQEAPTYTWIDFLESLPGVELIAWGASIWVFGMVVMTIVEFLKVRIRERWPGTRDTVFTLLSFLVSAVLTLPIYSKGYLTDPTFAGFPPPLDAIAFWLLAGSIASGWYDRTKALAKARGGTA